VRHDLRAIATFYFSKVANVDSSPDLALSAISNHLRKLLLPIIDKKPFGARNAHSVSPEHLQSLISTLTNLARFVTSVITGEDSVDQ